MENLGHNSKAMHWAYARKAQVTVPALEDYEKNAVANDNAVMPMPAIAIA
jgi:hypothetical protein